MRAALAGVGLTGRAGISLAGVTGMRLARRLRRSLRSGLLGHPLEPGLRYAPGLGTVVHRTVTRHTVVHGTVVHRAVVQRRLRRLGTVALRYVAGAWPPGRRRGLMLFTVRGAVLRGGRHR